MSVRKVCSPWRKSLKWICAAFVILNVILRTIQETKLVTFFGRDHTFAPRTSLKNHSEVPGVAICAIQKQGLKYLEEWIDYYLVLGINKIYLYDNSPDYELKNWTYNPARRLNSVSL